MTSTCALILSWYIKDSRSFFIWMLLSSSSTFVWLRKLFTRHLNKADVKSKQNSWKMITIGTQKQCVRHWYQGLNIQSLRTPLIQSIISFSSSINFLVTFFLLGTIWLSQRPYYVLLFNLPSLFSWKLISLQYEILHLKKSILPKYRHKFPRLPGTPSYPCYHWIIHIGTEHFFPPFRSLKLHLKLWEALVYFSRLNSLKKGFQAVFPFIDQQMDKGYVLL